MGSGTMGKPHHAWVGAWVVHGSVDGGDVVFGGFINDVLYTGNLFFII